MGTVRAIFRMIGAEGLSAGEVIRRLTDAGIPSPTGGRWHRPTIRNLVLGELYRPLTVAELEVASSGASLVSAKLLSTLDPERVYGLWTFNKKRGTKWRERGEDGEYRNRYRYEPRPREAWSAVPVDLTEAGLSRGLVDLARERVSQNERRPPSAVSQRFWQLSGGSPGAPRAAAC